MISTDIRPLLRSCVLLCAPVFLHAQSDVDAIMMGKKLLCAGASFSTGQWNQYWEGSRLRINQNLGTIRTNAVAAMGSLGVTKDMNIIYSLPWIQTRASAGQMTGLRGLQDFGLVAKYRFLRKKTERKSFSLFGIAGVSTPSQNYVKDYLPLSIGLGSTNLTMRLMADQTYKWFFTTASTSYIRRSNIRLDRQAYYTTRMIYSSEVQMPDALYSNIRLGYRSSELIAEFVADQWLTLGGFDITKNNMPFPSNRMIQTRVGLAGKYEPKKWKGLSLNGSVFHTVDGRNMGKSTGFQFGVFYIVNFSKSK
jgi:hypothetical protein